MLTASGSARASALSKFMNGSPSVLVATPGRLKDYLSEEDIQARFENLRTLILDEADTMLEQGFLQEVKHILRLLPPKSAGWQGMCFSATVPDKIKDVLKVVLAPGYATVSTIDTSEPPTHIR
jgi:ATP-dependent RNA helicase MSS116, mitochondrial